MKKLKLILSAIICITAISSFVYYVLWLPISLINYSAVAIDGYHVSDVSCNTKHMSIGDKYSIRLSYNTCASIFKPYNKDAKIDLVLYQSRYSSESTIKSISVNNTFLIDPEYTDRKRIINVIACIAVTLFIFLPISLIIKLARGQIKYR